MTLRKGIWAAVLTVWAAGVGLGMRELHRYGNTPGAESAGPGQWPASAPIERTPGHSMLLMFAHPQCVCSRASIGELARIMTDGKGRLDAAVFFLAPSAEPEQWPVTDLWQSAIRIPGVRVLRDRDGKIARAFGALTSGQVLLYDPSGHLVFHGGITPSRGEEGDNPGRYAIERLIRGESAPLQAGRVFGCALGG